MPQITIDARTWLKGASVSDEVANGGFSPDEKGIDLYATPGLIRPGQAVSTGSALSAQALSSEGVLAMGFADDPSDPIELYLLTAASNGDGLVMRAHTNAATGALVHAADTARDYVKNYSDLIRFASAWMWSSTTNVALGTTYDWWTTTGGGAALNGNFPHLFLEYESELFMTDGYRLHRMVGGVVSNNVLTLPTFYTMTAIWEHNGYIHIAAQRQDIAPPDDDLTGATSIFIWDGYSPTWLDRITLNDRITAGISHRGTNFVFLPESFGYINGDTFVHLWKLTTPVYKRMVTVVEDSILFCQTNPGGTGSHVVCYGSPIPGGKRVVSFPIKSTSQIFDAIGAGWIDDVSGVRRHKVRVFAGTQSYLMEFPMDPTATLAVAEANHRGNKIYFNGLVQINYIDIVTDSDISSSDDLTVKFLNSEGTTVTAGVLDSGQDSTQAGRRAFRFKRNGWEATYLFQDLLTWAASSTLKGVRQIIIDYEYVEGEPAR